MEVQHRHTADTGVFFIEQEGSQIAEMTYKQKNDVMVIDHTEVDDELQGQNIGSELVKEGVEYARKNGLKINPQCPFAKAVIQRHQEYQDVLR